MEYMASMTQRGGAGGAVPRAGYAGVEYTNNCYWIYCKFMWPRVLASAASLYQAGAAPRSRLLWERWPKAVARSATP